MKVSEKIFHNAYTAITNGEKGDLGNGYQIQLTQPGVSVSKGDMSQGNRVPNLQLIGKKGNIVIDLGPIPQSIPSKATLRRLNQAVLEDKRKNERKILKQYEKIKDTGGTLYLYGGGIASVSRNNKRRFCNIFNTHGIPVLHENFKKGKEFSSILMKQKQSDLSDPCIFLTAQDEKLLLENRDIDLLSELTERFDLSGAQLQAFINDKKIKRLMGASPERKILLDLQRLQNSSSTIENSIREEILKSLEDAYKSNDTSLEDKQEILQAALHGYCPIQSALEMCCLPKLAGSKLLPLKPFELKALEQLAKMDPNKLEELFEKKAESTNDRLDEFLPALIQKCNKQDIKELIEAQKISEQFLSQIINNLTNIYKSDASRNEKKTAMDTLACIYNNPTLPEINKKEIKEFIIDVLREESIPLLGMLAGVSTEDITDVYKQLDKQLGYKTIAMLADFSQISMFSQFLPGGHISHLGGTLQQAEIDWENYKKDMEIYNNLSEEQKVRSGIPAKWANIKGTWDKAEKMAKNLQKNGKLNIENGIIKDTYERCLRAVQPETVAIKQIESDNMQTPAVYVEQPNNYPKLLISPQKRAMTDLLLVAQKSQVIDELKSAISELETRLNSPEYLALKSGQSEFAKIFSGNPEEAGAIINLDRFPNAFDSKVKHSEEFDVLQMTRRVMAIGIQEITAGSYEGVLKEAKKRLAELQAKIQL